MTSKKIGLFLGPILMAILLSLPTPGVLSPEAWKVIAMAVFMLTWWVTEAVPLPVTALLPIICLPILGVSDMKTAAAPYASPIVFLFMGGFMIAVAMERWSLHRRIALNIVMRTGTNANRIILGFMLATAAMSMWISNTATTIMMLPIALSVIDLLTQKNGKKYSSIGIRNFALSIMLGVAYAANIGGTVTIIGTPPNVVFAGFIKQAYNYEVGFAQWMAIGLPFATILIAITYWFITKILHPNRLGEFAGAQEVIHSEVAKLGRMSKAEKRTLVIFLATALCWIFRSLINKISGFNLSDPGIAMLATIAVFVVPVNFKEGKFILEWKDTEKLPWGILLLFGGGLSLAAAMEDTGIIDLIGAQFGGYGKLGFWVILGLTAVSLYLTEVMSNVALVTIFLPVVGGIAVGMGMDPLIVCIPVTLASSCAFMLPMSTPPNAIVFASGYIKVSDMVRAGFILNIITILLVVAIITILIPLVF